MKRFARLFVTSTFLMISFVALAQAPQPGKTPATPTNNGQQNAQQAQNLPTKTQQFGDWNLICRKTGEQAQSGQLCELVQTIILNGQKAPFAEIAIGKPQADMPVQITVLVPINISFPSSVKVFIDEKDNIPLELSWARCMPVGCFASSPLKEDVQKKWGALENQGRVIFKAANTQDIAIPISYKGLKNALDALSKEK